MTRCVDLFAGAGGFSEAARLAGCRVVWAGNHNPIAVQVHAANHPTTVHACQDLQQADWHTLPRHDLLLASPSCQGHSRGASRGGSGRRGSAPKHDMDRATAWAVLSCLEVHRPALALVENVPEFLSWTLYETWLHGMRALGYSVSPHISDAADFGVPQHRKRLFLVCTRSKAPLVLNLPRAEHVSFGSALDLDAEGWELVSTKPVGVQGRGAKGRARFGGEFLTQHVTTHTGRSLDRPIGTVTCASHHWHLVRRGSRGDEIRPLNSLELRRAMGFADAYVLDGRLSIDTRLLGNAVSPPQGAAILTAMRAA